MMCSCLTRRSRCCWRPSTRQDNRVSPSVALRYCWGTTRDKWVVTKEANVIQHKQTIQYSQLPVTLRDLIVGLGFVAVMAAIFSFWCAEFVSAATLRLKSGICLLMVLCCVSFVITTTILHHVQSKNQGLRSFVGIEKGDVSSQCMWVAVCAWEFLFVVLWYCWQSCDVLLYYQPLCLVITRYIIKDAE